MKSTYEFELQVTDHACFAVEADSYGEACEKALLIARGERVDGVDGMSLEFYSGGFVLIGENGYVRDEWV